MRVLRELGGGFLYALVSVVLVIGGLSLSLAENYNPQRTGPTENFLTLPPTLPPTQVEAAAVNSATPLITGTPLPPTNCPPPVGWILIPVQAGDTLESLAARHNTTPQQLSQSNCLLTQNLIPGYNLYVPPSATATSLPCGPFPGWIQYTIQPGDTLFHIALLYGTTVAQLQRANCLGNSQYIRAGSRLWVPNVATITPGVTVIPDFPSETPTLPLTSTDLPFTGTPLPYTGTPGP